jgi:SNF2 family DNA or RNA helicase
MKLRPWQEDALTHREPRLLIQASPRIGKSLVAEEWLKQVKPRLTLIAAPLGVCPMWEKIAESILRALAGPTGASEAEVYTLYRMPVKRGLEALKRAKNGILICNYAKITIMVEKLLALGIEAIVVDESHKIKSPSTSQGRALRRLCWKATHVRLLTGTLTPKDAGDLWGQMVCVNKELWGSSFTKYKKAHLICDDLMYGKVLGVRKPDVLQEMVNNCALTYRREEVFGPDEWNVVVRTFDLEPKVRKLYDTAVKDWILKQEVDGLELDMTHTLSRMVRLQQLTGGHLPGESGPKHLHDNKLDLVMADLEDIVESGEKAVVFYRFSWEGEQIAERARKLGCPVFEINGRVGAVRRAAEIEQFAKTPVAVYVVQTAAGGVGISLATAQHALFVSQSFSFDDEEQARDRIFSPGKPRTVTYYRANRSIDNYIAYILETKQKTHEAVRSSRIADIAYCEVVRTEDMKF